MCNLVTNLFGTGGIKPRKTRAVDHFAVLAGLHGEAQLVFEHNRNFATDRSNARIGLRFVWEGADLNVPAVAHRVGERMWLIIG